MMKWQGQESEPTFGPLHLISFKLAVKFFRSSSENPVPIFNKKHIVNQQHTIQKVSILFTLQMVWYSSLSGS
jgi:hypothetical protein